MKKLSLLLVLACVISALAICAVGANAADDVVFIGGEGDAYANLKAAADALPSTGGTIVVRGPVVHGNDSNDAITLPAKPLVITSVYSGKDYRQDGAYFGLGRTLKLTADATFENIIIKQTHTDSTYGNIYAQGHKIIMGDGISTEAEAGTGKYPTVFGGFSAGDDGTGYASYVTIKSGTWQNVYGGSYIGKFNGSSTVTMTGGKVVKLISGGSRNGTQVGNTKLTISGGTVYDVCGGIYGVSGSSGALTGDIEIDICGNAVVEHNVFGVSYYGNIVYNGNLDIDIYGSAVLKRHVYGGCLGVKGKQNITFGDKGCLITIRENVTFTRPSDASNNISGGSSAGTVGGNVKVVIKDNVYFTGNVYAAGYNGSVNGNSTAEIYGGEVRVNFSGASRDGNVSGTATTLVYGGKIGYFTSNEGPYNVYGNYLGTVGNAIVVFDGADVAGMIALNGATGTITLKSGNAGSVDAKSVIDLSSGKTLTIGGAVSASNIIGGGNLVLSPGATVVADNASGDINLSINGEPVANQVYLTILNSADAAVVNYTPKDDEQLVKTSTSGKTEYTVKYSERYDTTTVRIYYYNPDDLNGTQPKIVLRDGVYSVADKITAFTSGKTEGKNYIEAALVPGLYSCKVYYGSGSDDYRIQYFYVSGKEASKTYEVPLEPYVANSWSENIFTTLNEEVMKLFGTDDLVGYEGFDTPTFSLTNNVRNFMNNEQLCEYVDNLGKNCSYLYVFYPFDESNMNNRTPVLVFTKDDISGMSFDEAAAYVRSRGQREIVMITGNKHGNEPAGSEGILVFSKDLTGNYGSEILDKIGAIVIMPSVEVDNTQRFKRLTEGGVNPNRDLVALLIESSQNQVYVYKSFMPTVCIDCHEDDGKGDIDSTDLSIENLDDICIRYSSNFNSPLYYGNILKEGTFNANDVLGNQIMLDAIENLRSTGLRSSIYYSGSTVPNTTSTYATLRGAYGFLVETMRIWTGTGRYERAVFGVEQALKSLFAEIIEADGSLAENVYAARAQFSSVTEYDSEHVLAGAHSSSGTSKVTMPRPTIYASGVWKNENGTKNFNLTDTLSNMIVLPTAYVLSADIEKIDDILAVLDYHGIPYTELKEGTTLTLRKYSGGYENTVIGAAAEVNLVNGGYAITMNTGDAYLIAYLMEPNSHRFTNAEDHSISFAHIGYIKDGDGLYRSEEDNIYLKIAKLGAVSEVTHASITVGSDLAVNAFARISDEYAEAVVRFTVADKVVEISNPTYDADKDLYRFTMPEMPPHGMTAEVTIELIIDGEVVDKVEGWTIRKYCDTLLSSTAEELDISESAKVALDILVKDILAYGAAAQQYTGYATDKLADASITASQFTPLADNCGAGVSNYDIDGVKIVGVGVRFDSVNKVFYQFEIGNADINKISIDIDGVIYTAEDFESPGNGVYVVYSKGIYATEFDSLVYATLYYEGSEAHAVKYCVNTFVYEMQNDMDGTELSDAAVLARRLYLYGIASKAYVEATK